MYYYSLSRVSGMKELLTGRILICCVSYTLDKICYQLPYKILRFELITLDSPIMIGCYQIAQDANGRGSPYL
ncbi:hypothetical protein C8R32_102166 [Nitrosospira sp. Nsp5]|uniref:Uncharacterized protein n=1 Tax=Nitrosospira multiformis TaxID=1231 RepID=A0ABY0TQB6_9PROT|nr:hypothetical protein C8R32_102166 [Nitrosospira sp. Nsp5]SDQ97942.1 hypothetical protein SAMN05216402_3092 [Nitrosospira multiformis]